MREALAERPQLGDTAQDALDEEAVHHGVQTARELGIVRDEFVRDRAAETIASALGIETQQMIAIRTGAVDPQLADHAVDQGLVHWDSVHWPPLPLRKGANEFRSVSRHVAPQYRLGKGQTLR